MRNVHLLFGQVHDDGSDGLEAFPFWFSFIRMAADGIWIIEVIAKDPFKIFYRNSSYSFQ